VRPFRRPVRPGGPPTTMPRRHQAVLPLEADPGEVALTIGPSMFRPGQTPRRFQPDPRMTPQWKRLRKTALKRDHFACRRCGQPASDVDHRVELIDGGAAFDLENLQALCAPCHDAKSSESRYRRARRATSSWGRMALCPRCSGTGLCIECPAAPHPCTVCLGVRFTPESCAERGEVPSQSVISEVSSLAWAGAEPPPP
jgi:HNH endonuclease